jgi:hypothetical protein
MQVFEFLIPASLVLVFAVLVFGLIAMFRGGDFGRSWSNKAMRMRVLVQFVAICVLVAAMLAKQHLG